MSKNTFKFVFFLPPKFYNFQGQKLITFKDRYYLFLNLKTQNLKFNTNKFNTNKFNMYLINLTI